MRELEFIGDSLRAVSPYVRERYAKRGELSVRGKRGAMDLLTEVDLEVQRRLVEAIGKTFPKDAIVAEEAGLDQLPADRKGRCWFIDPIDGTQNFVRGMFPQFGVSLAFAEAAEVRAGGVAMAGADILMLAGRGHGATANGKPMRVSSVDKLTEARIDVDFGYPHQRKGTLDLFSDLICEAGQFRCYCAAVAGLCAVACGETDVYTAMDTQPWDSTAGALLVEEAGGRVSTLSGEPLNLVYGHSSIVASNGAVHDAFIGRVRLPAATGR